MSKYFGVGLNGYALHAITLGCDSRPFYGSSIPFGVRNWSVLVSKNDMCFDEFSFGRDEVENEPMSTA